MHPWLLLLAALLLGAQLFDHAFAHAVIGHAEFLPPVGQLFAHLAHVGAQAQEIETRPETRLPGQAEG